MNRMMQKKGMSLLKSLERTRAYTIIRFPLYVQRTSPPPSKKQNYVCALTMQDMKDLLQECGFNRGDKCGLRLQENSDVTKFNFRYHTACYKQLINVRRFRTEATKRTPFYRICSAGVEKIKDTY